MVCIVHGMDEFTYLFFDMVRNAFFGLERLPRSDLLNIGIDRCIEACAYGVGDMVCVAVIEESGLIRSAVGSKK